MPRDPAVGAPDGRGRFIPFRRADLIEMLCAEEGLDASDRAGFPALAGLLSATVHAEFRDRLEALKDAYAPFARDPDTRPVRTWDTSERGASLDRLVDDLRRLLEDANFRPVGPQELERAFHEESLVALRVEVDFGEFDRLLVYRRGETRREEERSSLLGLRRRTVTFTNYEKVLVFVTFKDAEHFTTRGTSLQDLLDVPGTTIIKLFQDVPRGDMELLFPNARVRMRVVDKLLIGVPAAAGAAIVLVTKLLTTLGLLIALVGFWLGVRDDGVDLDQDTLVALGLGLGAVGGYLVRQYTKFKNRKLEFLNTLARTLYFRNLDNDAGVFHNLLDAAEEEEVKEAVLGWWFLRGAAGPLTPRELDEAVERWFAGRWDARLDFETADGLARLRSLRLVEEDGERRLVAVPAAEAMRRLGEHWDAIA